MSGREFKPGDVAMVTIPGRPEQQMTRYTTNYAAGWFQGEGPSRESKAHFADNASGRGAKARPLVVIDPEGDIEQVWTTLRDGLAVRSRDNLRDVLRDLADPKTPKPDEPTGLGAVVVDKYGIRWVRVADGSAVDRWKHSLMLKRREWSHIEAVEVLSEGVK